MKKRLIIILVASILAVGAIVGLSVGLAYSCGGKSHEHTYSTEWSKDESGHWHAATCEHTGEKTDFGEHADSDNNGKCDVCDYEISHAPDARPLDAPEITINSNVISWNAVANADGYEVYENSVLVSMQAGTSYTVTKKSAAGNYVYAVKATSDNKDYTDSGLSESVTFIVSALGSPVAELEGNVVKWNSVENAQTYSLYENGSLLSANAQSPYTIQAKTEPGDYAYTVVASSSDPHYIDSAASNPVTYTVTKLATPVVTLTEKTLNWNDITGAALYEIYIDGSYFDETEETTYTIDTDLLEPGNYTVTVKAISALYNKLDSDESEGQQITRGEGAVKLAAPKLRIEIRGAGHGPADDRVTVQLTYIVWDPVPNADLYEVYCMKHGAVDSLQTTTSFNVCYSLAGSYTYLIKAVPASGNGKYVASDQSEITYVNTPLDSPVVSIKDNVLSWEPVEGATDYVVRIREDTDNPDVRAALNISEDLNEDGLSYTINDGYHYLLYGEGLVFRPFLKGHKYYFCVMAASMSGNVHAHSYESNFILWEVSATPLEAPVVKLDGKVISWNAVENATAYEIYENNKLVTSTRELSYTITRTIVGTYNYYVIATSSDVAYSNSLPSNTIVYNPLPGSTTTLAAPVIRIDEEDGRKVIKWSAVDNATSYLIYENGVRIATVNYYGGEEDNELTYILSRLNPGTYEYGVKSSSVLSEFRTSAMSNTVTHTVEATEVHFMVTITVPANYRGTTTFTVGLFKGDRLIESKQITVDLSGPMSGTETFIQMADEYTAKITSTVPNGYIATQAILTAESYLGAIRLMERSDNMLKMGTNTFTVKNNDAVGADQEYIFIPERTGVYTFRTNETKGMLLEINGVIGIETSQELNVYSINLHAGEAIKVVFVGGDIGSYTMEIVEGEVKQYLNITTGWGVNPANYLFGSCTRYLTLAEDTILTFSFTTATTNTAIVVITIDGVEYEFDGDAFNTQNILIKAGTDIEITFVVIGVEFTRANYISFFVYPASEKLSAVGTSVVIDLAPARGKEY